MVRVSAEPGQIRNNAHVIEQIIPSHQQTIFYTNSAILKSKSITAKNLSHVSQTQTVLKNCQIVPALMTPTVKLCEILIVKDGYIK